MSDSIRMMDLSALQRNAEELRNIDPEQRTLAQRIAARLALKHVEETHQDVEASYRPEEAQVEDHNPHPRRRRAITRRPAPPPQPDADSEPPAEVSEGHLLDIKA